MVFRSPRDKRRSGHRCLATDKQSLHRQGHRAHLVLRLGSHPSAAARPIAEPQPIHTSGMGVTAASRYSVSVAPNSTSTLTFVIAGSATDSTAAVAPTGTWPRTMRASRKEKGTLCLTHRTGESKDSRPTPAGGLQLGEDQHRVARQRDSRHRPRSRCRPDGIPMVVRD